MSSTTEAHRVSVAWRLERIPQNSYLRFIGGVILLSYFVEAIDNGAVGYFMPLFAKEFSLDNKTLGLVGTVSNIGVMIGALFSGLFCDTLGRKKIIVASMFAWGVCGLFLANAWSLESLIAARILLGLGLGAQVPAVLTILSELLPSKLRGYYFTVCLAFLPLGAAAAGLLSYYLVPVIGWRGVAVIEAIPCLLALVIWKYVPESPFWLETKGRYEEADAIMNKIEQRVVEITGKPLPAVHVPNVTYQATTPEKAPLKELFSREHIKSTLLVTIWWPTALAALYGLMTWFSVLLVAKGFPIMKSIGYISLMYVSGILGIPFVRYSVEKFGRKATAMCLGALSALAAYLYGISTTLPLIFAFGILYNFFSTSAGMVNNMYTAELFPTRIRGTGTGYASFIGRIGAILGPLIIGFIMQGFGVQAVFYFAMLMYLIFVVAIGVLGHETKGKVFTE